MLFPHYYKDLVEPCNKQDSAQECIKTSSIQYFSGLRFYSWLAFPSIRYPLLKLIVDRAHVAAGSLPPVTHSF